MRMAHPPTCPYPGCRGKSFSQQKGLKAHLKIHGGREVDDHLDGEEGAGDDDEPAAKKRRGGEYGRDWICDFEGCTKDFKSVFSTSRLRFSVLQLWVEQKKALTMHYNISHLYKRDFVCPHEGCDKAYGYKHLLQRHDVQAHRLVTEFSDHSSSPEDDDTKGAQMDIDGITGRSYLERNAKIRGALRCPHPHLPSTFVSGRGSELSVSDSMTPCEHVFGRAYDLRRHMLSGHGLTVEKGVMDAWVEDQRR